MNASRLSGLVAGFALLALSPALEAALGPALPVSAAAPGAAASASAAGSSLGSMISPDGSFVVFMSDADNLVPNTRNGPVLDVFLRSRTNGAVSLLSVNAAGTGGGNGHSMVSSFTPDGRFVVFTSAASNLVPGDTNDANDVFVRDLARQETRCVSLNTSGAAANGASSEAAITPDGRYVAFVSAAEDLVAGDTNGIPDVFRRDLETGLTTLVSAGARALVAAGSRSSAPVISTNGQWVAFTSTASNLVAGLVVRNTEVYVRDLSAGATLWAATNLEAVFPGPVSSAALSYQPALSEDGRWLAFKAIRSNSFAACLILRRDLSSGALELVAANADATAAGMPDASGPVMTPDGRFIAYTTAQAPLSPRQVVLWDSQSGTTAPVSVNLDGVLSPSGTSDTPAVSRDGRYVSFVSDAPDLVTNAVNGEFQVYVRDLLSETTRLVSIGPDGEGGEDAGSAMPTLDDAGRQVAFDGPGRAFVAQDGNRADDVFVWDADSGGMELVSAAGAGMDPVTGNGASTLGGQGVSADGRWAVFTSLADDLWTGHTNGYFNLYARDLLAGTNVLVSAALGGAAADGSSGSPVISANGRSVAFVSTASNLVGGDINQKEDVFVRDLVAGVTELVSVGTSAGHSGNGRSLAPSLSADGRRVAFQSAASDLAPGDTDSLYDDVFVRDLTTGTTTLVSGQVPGVPSNTSFLNPLISPDGRFVAFASTSTSHKLLVKDTVNGTLIDYGTTNFLGSAAFSGDSRWFLFARSTGTSSGSLALVFQDLLGATQRQVVFPSAIVPPAGSVRVQLCVDGVARFAALACSLPLTPADTNFTQDVYLYDSAADNLNLISRNLAGTAPGNAASFGPSLSADGRFLAFHSWANDLVPGDLSDAKDVFLHDRLTGGTLRASVTGPGFDPANDRSSDPVLSADGRRLLFNSLADNLAGNDFNQTPDVFALDIAPDPVVIDPHPVFSCAAVRKADGRTEVTWNGAPGRAYRAEFKDDLAAPSWTGLVGTAHIVGAHATISDAPSVDLPQRYYRVVLVD